MTTTVPVLRWRGSAREFHGRSIDDVAVTQVWEFAVLAPALVIGSAQPVATIDEAAGAAAGVDVVRRRSGGGAVLVRPDEVVWFDVVVPVADLRRHGIGDDIARSMVWLGERAGDALAALGHVEGAVHRGPMVTTPWSRTICFAGLGPGEVTVAGAKLVGISQRRTRAAARFQCAVHVAWRPDVLVDLLAPPRPTAAECGAVATLPATLAAELPAAVAVELAR